VIFNIKNHTYEKNIVICQQIFLFLQPNTKEIQMMLKEILSISGKPGLFKLISKGKNMFVAESLIDQKRIPVYSRDKAVSLGDITVYADNEDTPLKRILHAIKQKENAGLIAFSPNSTPDELRTYFAQVLPDFDRERVYPSDIKKIMNWYNLLINSGITEFEDNESNEENEGNESNESNENK
jgi:hypothetical protein